MPKIYNRHCDQCNIFYIGRGPRFCSKPCFQQWLREQNPLAQRLWSKVNKGNADKCWPWTGNKDKDGYATIWANGKNISVQRATWQVVYGDPPKGKFIRHNCGNTICCNPNHLFIHNPQDIFCAKVNIKDPDQCWEWTGTKNRDGYGIVKINKQEQRTHRVAWRLSNGPIPKEQCVLHRCDNRCCTNPAHLFLGTQQDNIADMIAKGRQVIPKGVQHGNSKLTEKDVLKIRSLKQQGVGRLDIAKQFGIYKSTVDKITSRQSWKHI